MSSPSSVRVPPVRRLVDPRGPRFAAAVTTVVLAVVLLTGSVWLLAAQAVVFALGAAGRSPYGVALRPSRPSASRPAGRARGLPRRSGSRRPSASSSRSSRSPVSPCRLVTVVATAAALAAAFLNAAFGICLGCEIYLLARRATSRRHRPHGPQRPHRHPRTEVAA